MFINRYSNWPRRLRGNNKHIPLISAAYGLMGLVGEHYAKRKTYKTDQVSASPVFDAFNILNIKI